MLPISAQVGTDQINAANQLLQSNEINKLLLGMVVILIICATLIGWTFLKGQQKISTDKIGTQETIIELAKVIGNSIAQSGEALTELVTVTKAFVITTDRQTNRLDQLDINLEAKNLAAQVTQDIFAEKHERIEKHFTGIEASMVDLKQQTDKHTVNLSDINRVILEIQTSLTALTKLLESPLINTDIQATLVQISGDIRGILGVIKLSTQELNVRGIAKDNPNDSQSKPT